jgi:hypothetical protein
MQEMCAPHLGARLRGFKMMIIFSFGRRKKKA